MDRVTIDQSVVIGGDVSNEHCALLHEDLLVPRSNLNRPTSFFLVH